MKTLLEMARQVEAEGFAPVGIWPEVRRLCELVRADEREACAKVCDEMRVYVGRDNAVIQSSAKDCATAIREMSNT